MKIEKKEKKNKEERKNKSATTSGNTEATSGQK